MHVRLFSWHAWIRSQRMAAEINGWLTLSFAACNAPPFRASCTTLLEANGCYLHVTPLRATRPLAVRWLARRAGVDLETGVLLVVDGDGDGDKADLMAGVHKVGAWAWEVAG